MLMIPELGRVARTDDNYVGTYTGRKFWPLDPCAEDVCIEDIAHHLSLEGRFTGATYCHYSVGEHSIRVSVAAERLVMAGPGPLTERVELARYVALWGLLHDASKAYLRDMVSPLKHHSAMGTIYRFYKRLVMQEIALKFEIGADEPPAVATADKLLLYTEHRDLVTGSTKWQDKATLPETIFPMDAQRVEMEFLNRFDALTLARRAAQIAAAGDPTRENIELDLLISTPLSEAARRAAPYA